MFVSFTPKKMNFIHFEGCLYYDFVIYYGDEIWTHAKVCASCEKRKKVGGDSVMSTSSYFISETVELFSIEFDIRSYTGSYFANLTSVRI